MNYTLDHWENNYIPEDGPTDDEIASFPSPEKASPYKPAWGKYSEPARKASFTRAAKVRDRNAETFAREILPQIESRLCPEALFENAKQLKSRRLLRLSGFQCWSIGERFAWLPAGDAREKEAEGMGAKINPSAQPWS